MKSNEPHNDQPRARLTFVPYPKLTTEGAGDAKPALTCTVFGDVKVTALHVGGTKYVSLSEGFGIVANVGEADRAFRLGAKCWLVGGTGGEGWTRFIWWGMSRSGRMIEKWCATERFKNFRAAYIPPPVRKQYPDKLFAEGSRQEMEERARLLNEYRATRRPLA